LSPPPPPPPRCRSRSPPDIRGWWLVRCREEARWTWKTANRVTLPDTFRRRNRRTTRRWGPPPPPPIAPAGTLSSSISSIRNNGVRGRSGIDPWPWHAAADSGNDPALPAGRRMGQASYIDDGAFVLTDCADRQRNPRKCFRHFLWRGPLVGGYCMITSRLRGGQRPTTARSPASTRLLGSATCGGGLRSLARSAGFEPPLTRLRGVSFGATRAASHGVRRANLCSCLQHGCVRRPQPESAVGEREDRCARSSASAITGRLPAFDIARIGC
jgi:hypothetical protein